MKDWLQQRVQYPALFLNNIQGRSLWTYERSQGHFQFVIYQMVETAWVVYIYSTARIIFTFMSLWAVQNMSHFKYLHSCHFHCRLYYKLSMACSAAGLISHMDRALRWSGHPKGQGSIPGQAWINFQVLVQPLSLRITPHSASLH